MVGVLPFSCVRHTASTRTRTPVAAVWPAALAALALGSPTTWWPASARHWFLDPAHVRAREPVEN